MDSSIPPFGEVKLTDKTIPIFEKGPPFDENYAYTRAIVDVSKFKEKIHLLPPGIWEDEKQQGNVKLVRPAHDKWGIKKIVFVFCDDFLQKILDLPWSKDEEWRQHLLPIYESVGVNERRVVRSLLASMPPGMTIPVHNDSGYWVKKTHRLHVAIDTGPEVDFFVGPTNDTLRKVNSSFDVLVESIVTSSLCIFRYYLMKVG